MALSPADKSSLKHKKAYIDKVRTMSKKWSLRIDVLENRCGGDVGQVFDKLQADVAASKQRRAKVSPGRSSPPSRRETLAVYNKASDKDPRHTLDRQRLMSEHPRRNPVPLEDSSDNDTTDIGRRRGVLYKQKPQARADSPSKAHDVRDLSRQAAEVPPEPLILSSPLTIPASGAAFSSKAHTDKIAEQAAVQAALAEGAALQRELELYPTALNPPATTQQMPDDVFHAIFGQILATSEGGHAITTNFKPTGTTGESAQVAAALIDLNSRHRAHENCQHEMRIPGMYPTNAMRAEPMLGTTKAPTAMAGNTLHAIGIPSSVATYFANDKYFTMQDLVKGGFEESDVEPCMHYLMQEKIVPFVDGIIARRKLKAALQGMATAKRR